MQRSSYQPAAKLFLNVPGPGASVRMSERRYVCDGRSFPSRQRPVPVPVSRRPTGGAV